MAATKPKPAAKKAAKKTPAKKAPAKKAAAKRKPAARKPRTTAPVNVATSVRQLIAKVNRTDAEGVALGAIAFNLATLLDAGAGMSSAAVARELRETIDRMCALDAGDEDAFDAWEKQLSEAT